MKWYTGTIPEAVAHAQAKKALFCVAIFGEDANSTGLLTSLESNDIQKLIEKEGVISIRINSNSEEFAQFGAIYSNVSSPSIYCITTGGVAVQVISGYVDPATLKSRFDTALQRHREALGLTSTGSSQAPSTSASATPAPQSPPTASSIANPEPSSSDAQPASSETSTTEPTLEEKIERAKQLAAAKQAQKKAEEDAEARRRETERREAGRKVAELKRWQMEEETKRLAEERRKDKQEEAALRQRVKDQIAQDRIDREARAQAARAAETPAQAPPAPRVTSGRDPAASNYTGLARLQFRLPDGSSHSHAFEPQQTLNDVREYLTANIEIPRKGFTLSIAFPRRAFTPEDYGNSLRDLGLLPTATLLIIPNAETSILARGGGGAGGVMPMLYAVMQVLLSPFTFLWSWIRPGGTPAPPESQATSSGGGARSIPPRKLPAAGANSGAEDGARQRRTGAERGQGQSFGRVEGNIHRFPTNQSDSDDEQGTYNGNSTQQM